MECDVAEKKWIDRDVGQSSSDGRVQKTGRNLREKAQADQCEATLAFASKELAPTNIGCAQEIEEPGSTRRHKSFVSRPLPNPSECKFQDQNRHEEGSS